MAVWLASSLFFGTDTSRFLPQSGIDMNCFNGTAQTADMTDYKSPDSTVPELIESAEQFVKINCLNSKMEKNK